MGPRLTFSWSPDARVRTTVPVESVEDLDAVLSSVGEAARTAGVAIQIDIWAGPWTGNGELPEPYLQAFLGHADRAALIWIEDGAVEVGVDPALEEWPRPLRYERGARLEEMDGEWTRLSPETVSDALREFVASGTRPSLFRWVDPFDDDAAATPPHGLRDQTA